MSGDLFDKAVQSEAYTPRTERCFVITPIGSETDPIRRHIDGVIKAAIQPAFEDKYEVFASHMISQPGTITKQIIQEIYCDKLVIANLTANNPNVMYELALRYCLPKAVILIAEEGTRLPSDLLMNRTIFYRNDALGTLELKKRLVEAESKLDFDQVESPVYDVLRELGVENQLMANLESKSNDEIDLAMYVLKRLDNIDSKLQDFPLGNRPKDKKCVRFAYIYHELDRNIPIEKEPLSNATDYVDPMFPGVTVWGFGGIPNSEYNIVYIDVIIQKIYPREAISNRIKESLEAEGYIGLVDCALPAE